jgi:anti-sigma regulatory factor (Ser/Thr protein kinase)
MRFGIRPQAALLAAVPLVALVLLLALGSLLVEQTRQGAVLSARVADDLTRSEQMIETISHSNRIVQQYAKTKSPADYARLLDAGSTAIEQTRTFERAIARDPALAPIGRAYGRYTLAGMDVMKRYADAIRAGNMAAATALGAAPATRQLSMNLEHAKVQFDQAAQARSGEQLDARRDTARKTEAGLVVVALAGIAGTTLVALLFGMRIVARLRLLGDNARRLSEGLPTVPDTGNDEITELDRIYRTMADRIQASSEAHSEVMAELRRERDVASVLQQALLPEIPSIPGLRLDTAYATPAEGAQIGGDWFDVFPISERLIGLSVGDVTGHGLRAAATMGFVRQAIRIVARLGADPAAVMERVNHVVCEESGAIVTAFFGVFDNVTGALTYTLAGHGPPLVATPGGAISLLAGDGMLLGLDDATRFTPHERQLAPGDALILYTDGIVEAERDYLKGMRDLENAVRAEVADPAANMAEGIQHRIFNEAAPRDDSAVLVLKVLQLDVPAGEDGPRAWHFDARDQRTAWSVKRALLSAFEELGPAAPDATIAEMVFGELLSNVVRHTPGSARISLDVSEGHAVLHVEDRGRPLPAGVRLNDGFETPDGNAESGRGLFLIGALCRRIVTEATSGGKRISVMLPRAVPEPRPSELAARVGM